MNRSCGTQRIADVLDAIRAYKQQNGISPTNREIMRATGISSLSVVNYYLSKLIRDGSISKIPNVSRGILLKGEPGYLAHRPPLQREKPFVEDPYVHIRRKRVSL